MEKDEELFIYNKSTKIVVAIAYGQTCNECKRKSIKYSDSDYGKTYSLNGLVRTTQYAEIL